MTPKLYDPFTRREREKLAVIRNIDRMFIFTLCLFGAGILFCLLKGFLWPNC